MPIDPYAEATEAVRRCTLCAEHLPLGPRPVLRGSEAARLLIVGQAPGTKVHASGVPWDDRSGLVLRDWLGITPDVFYDEARVAILPTGLCYPGVLPQGGDAPPRPECAPRWHFLLRPLLAQVRLTLLVGGYAQKFYLRDRMAETLTDTVRDFRLYLPDYFPLPHPSWRSQVWQKRNPWFAQDLLPLLRTMVRAALA